MGFYDVYVNVLPPPEIASFTANPASILNGQETELLNGEVKYYGDRLTLEIDQGVGVVSTHLPPTPDPRSPLMMVYGNRVVRPAVTTTYTLTATSAYGTSKATCTVTVNPWPKPIIKSFSASSPTIYSGQPVSLPWSIESTGAATVVIDHGVGAVSGAAQAPVVYPTETTTYTLTATNKGGSTTATCTVIVNPWPKPIIKSFTASSPTIYRGQPVSLPWSIDSMGDATVTIDHGVGTVSGNNAAPIVYPTETTTYTLTATNKGGPTTATCTVTVRPAPGITSLIASSTSVNCGQPVTLSWATAGDGVSLSLDQGIGIVEGNSYVVLPGWDTTYTLTATNPSGSVSSSTASITVNQPPDLIGDHLGVGTIVIPPCTAGQAIDFTLLAARDPEGDAIGAYSVVGLPAGLSFNPATRTLSGTIASPGAYRFLYCVTDDKGAMGSTKATLTVQAAGTVLSPSVSTMKISYAYDDQGRLSTLTYPSGKIVTYTYDNLDRPTKVTYNGQTVVKQLSYDPWGSRSTQVGGSGAVSQWKYDPTGSRVTQRTLGLPNAESPAINWNYAYDAADRLVQAGTWDTLAYDVNSRLTQAVGLGMTNNLAHDAYNNNISSVSTSAGALPVTMNNYTFGPMADNLLPGQARNGGLTDAVYSNFGEVLQVAKGISAPSYLTMTWDGLGRMISTKNSADNSVESFSYAASGYRVSRSDTQDRGLNRNYAYTSQGHLLSENLGNAEVRIYHKNGTNCSLTRYFEKFEAGDVVTLTGWFKTRPGLSGSVFLGDNDGADPYDNVSFVELPATGNWQKITVTHTMSHDDQMSIHLDADRWTSTSASATDEDSVLWDDVQVSSTKQGVVLQEGFENGYGDWISAGQPTEIVFQNNYRDVVYLGSEAIAQVDSTGIHELHNDHLGTPRIITGPKGTIVGTQAYGPYGEQIEQTGYIPITGYTGHIQTEPTGLIYMRGRFYSPAWHRFMNSDQGVDPGGLNQFCYVVGTPLMHTDPTGMYDPDSGHGSNFRDSKIDHSHTEKNDKNGTKTTTDKYTYKDGTIVEKSRTTFHDSTLRGTVVHETYKHSSVDPITKDVFEHSQYSSGSIHFDDDKAAKSYETKLLRQQQTLALVQTGAVFAGGAAVSEAYGLHWAVTGGIGTVTSLGFQKNAFDDEDAIANVDGSRTWHYESAGVINFHDMSRANGHW